MPSSPTESFEDLARLYDQAFEALRRDDVERVGLLIDRAEHRLSELPATQHDDHELGELRRKARESLNCLVDAIGQAQSAARDELRKVREGRKVIAGYARPAQRRR